MIIEPQFSEFYSVAPDKELSSIVKKELQQMVAVSPVIADYFHATKEIIECKLTSSKFQPLAYSENRMDGRHADVFVVDEVNKPASYSRNAIVKWGKIGGGLSKITPR